VKQLINKGFFYFLLPIFLFVFGAFNLFNYLKASEFGITNLDVRELSNYKTTRPGELLKGDIVSGSFRSKFPNLGIVSIRFFNQNRDSKDTLVFRLKEEGADKWLYEAKYETDQFLPHKHFPFGFPIIKNSADRAYEFQLESLRGATGSGIFIDYSSMPFVAKSSFQKSELLHDKKLLTFFISNKITNILGDPDIFLNTFLFFLPFIFFIIFLTTNGLSYQYLTVLISAFVLYDIFGISKNYDFAFLSVLLAWGLISHRFRFASRIAAVYATSFLILTPIMLIFKEDALAEKTSVWAYLFLCITVVQQVYDLKKKTIKPLTLRNFIHSFPNFSISNDFWINSISKPVRKAVEVVTLSLFTLIMIGSQIIRMVKVIPKFVAFYQDIYLMLFIRTLLLPQVILLISIIFAYIYLRKVTNPKLLLIVLLILFNLSSGKIISNAISFENEPRIISVSPNPAGEAWTDIVITGKNFRNIPFVGKVYIDGVEQGEYVVLWSDEQIVFRTSPTITRSGFIKVVPLDRSSSNAVHFEYDYK